MHLENDYGGGEEGLVLTWEGNNHRGETMRMDSRIEELGRMTAHSEDGQATHLSDLWAKQPAALVFVRHFG